LAGQETAQPSRRVNNNQSQPAVRFWAAFLLKEDEMITAERLRNY
jgi:hypothetical protein